MKHFLLIISGLFILSSCSTIDQKVQPLESANSQQNNTIITLNNATQQTDQKNKADSEVTNSQTNKNNDTPSEENIEATSDQPTDFYANSIEEALEFCDASQKFREKKDPENALKALDQAYRIITDIPPEENLLNQQLDDLRFTIAKRILEIYSTRTDGTKGMAEEIPLTMNSHIEKEIKRLTGRERRYFIYSYKRSGKYMDMILKKLKDAGLPKELAWLPLIESGFKDKALSSARALGLWQFIPSTGYKFGLKRNLYIDERLDPEASTDAAIAYLKELHSIFGDWSTVLAAYNCGEGRVLRTIRKQNLRYLDNFWDLYLQLPYETASYVPRFIATLHIVKNLEKYGFKELVPYESYKYEKVFIDKSVHLKDIAKYTNSSFEDLKELNPALRYDIVPPNGYNVRVPLNTSKELIAQLKSIPERKIHKSYAMHKVKRGETLSGIAEIYKTSVKSIMLTNRLSKKNYIVPGQLLKIPSKTYLASVVKKPVISKTKSGTLYYTVRRGDSLWSIAQKFRTTPQKLKQLNNLQSDLLSIGQQLTIRINLKNTFATYQVKPGDSPFKIASQHNMSLSRFLNINDMNKASKIFPGQKVYVE